jgi:hypothetical protein
MKAASEMIVLRVIVVFGRAGVSVVPGRTWRLRPRSRDVDQVIARYLRMIDDTRPRDAESTLLEHTFERVAKSFSDYHGIDYDTWRDLGVPADVLQRCRLDL